MLQSFVLSAMLTPNRPMGLTREALEEAKERGELRYGNPLTDDCCYAGFNPFHTEDCKLRPDCFCVGAGSFEVFYRAPSLWQGEGTHTSDEEERLEPGWYWWPCFPDCLPTGAPSGPFPTAESAYLNAIEEITEPLLRT
jgi:hypothetical protein